MAWWHDVARKNHPLQMLRDALKDAHPGSSLARLTPQDRTVLWVLVSFSDWDTGKNARPGLDVLSQTVGATPRSVQRSLGRLIDYRLIERTRRGYTGQVASYRIDLDHVENGAGESARGLSHE